MSILYANKIPHPSNFAFTNAARHLRITPLGGDAYRIHSTNTKWKNPSRASLAKKLPGKNACALKFDRAGTLQLTDSSRRTLLETTPRATLGHSGDTWMLQFRHNTDNRYYGLGENSRGLEKSGQRVKFWNTDLIGDFSFDEIKYQHPSPMYVSIPWLIVKRGDAYIGILVNHPGCVFVDVASNFIWEAQNDADLQRRSYYLGAPNGQPDITLLVGPSLAELTRKFQTLVGHTPLPPLWALGYHQSRWGYAGPRDLNRIDAKLRDAKIPCDALWLDIDYMDRYKVFTFEKKHWGNLKQTRAALADLRKRGRRVITMIDPGVKAEHGYEVCDDGLKRDLFCHNRNGKPYTGFAWPGHTYFPDFSLPETRAWWAKRVEAFARHGIAAAWIDMNDPSVGGTEPDDMLFNRGRMPHSDYHNQYAHGMADATRAGLIAARPDERPFILTRSASTGTGSLAAVWTGDNMSNWHHLRMSIPTMLGLGLSGIPFTGADVGGFADHSNRELLIAWYKAAFLSPFFRNHNSAGVRDQEPWVFGKSAERIIAHYVRLRYKFLPYIYQLFVRHAETGDAVLRPLIHDFSSTRALPLDHIDNQFLIGRALMQAPVVVENTTAREVVLPTAPGKTTRWFSLSENKWLAGGQKLTVRATENDTPLYVRDASLIPLRPSQTAENKTDLREIELHAFIAPGTKTEAICHYTADDGETNAHQRGKRTTATITARLTRDGTLIINAATHTNGYGPLRVRIFTYEGVRQIQLITASGKITHALRPATWRATGKTLTAQATGWIKL